MRQKEEVRSHLTKSEVGLIVIGVTFCLLGLFISKSSVSTFISSPGTEYIPPSVRSAFWILRASLILWGGLTIAYRNREMMVNLNLALISVLIFAPIAAEVSIRSAIKLDVEFLSNPRLYAGWLDDDDHWKLRYQWHISEEPVEGVCCLTDPLLGWAPETTAQNPLGVLSGMPYQPDYEAPTVLFYGDSYVYGMSPTPIEDRIPQQLDVLLPEYAVYNYGVVGYGLDQIYLRFRETHSIFDEPFIIVGVYTLDLDRSILQVRGMPKPYFEIENGRLILNGTPIPGTMEQWLEENPVSIKSYFLAFLVRQFRIMYGGFQITEIPYRQFEKKELNGKIIEEIVGEASTHNLPILFVLFYPEWELEYTGWRETFFTGVLDQLNVPYIDTKQLFLSQALLPIQFYDTDHGHLNKQGGRVVAQAIVEYIDKSKWILTPNK